MEARLNGVPNKVKLNLLRASVGQPQVADVSQAPDAPFCYYALLNATQRLQNNQELTIQPYPDATMAKSWYTMMTSSASANFLSLQCDHLLDTPSPFMVKYDPATGAAVDAFINLVNAPLADFLATDPYLAAQVTPATPTLHNQAVPLKARRPHN